MEPAEILGSIMAVVLGVYIAFILTQEFCSTTPEFCSIGRTIIAALVIGAVFFLKFKLFR